MNGPKRTRPMAAQTALRPFIALALLLAGVALAQEAAPGLPAIDDAALLSQMPGGELNMPSRLFTPELMRMFEDGEVRSRFLVSQGGNVRRGERWLTVALDRWRETIAPHAPISAAKMYTTDSGRCPFCGNTFLEPVMLDNEFLDAPFQVKTACCGQTIFEREADMPADYKARPNHTETVPHLDGTTYDYRFFVPPGTENAPLGRRTDRKHWFCSAGEVWRARMRVLTERVIPDLMARVFQHDDERAALILAVIFDRLAEVYPGLPLYAWAEDDYGFARGRNDTTYLTREDYLAHPRPARYRLPYWHRGYNYDKLNAHITGWRDGVVAQAGMLAEAWDLLRDRPEVKRYSTERYGDEDRWEALVRKNVVDEAALVAAVSPSTRGNTANGWVVGGVRLGAVVGDEYFMRTALGLIESYISNAYFSDGLSEEGAFNYAAMNRSIMHHRWMLPHFAGIDLNRRYPILDTIAKGDYRVVTLLGVESMHGDQHGSFFNSLTRPAQTPPNYQANEASQCFPEYGLTALRAGAPGSRLEAIMDFQSAVGHTHPGRLNLQLFYEGVNLLPDLGYGVRLARLDQEPWNKVTFRFEKMDNPFPGHAGPFGSPFAQRPQTHCTALVDGYNHKLGPTTFHRYLGGHPSTHPAYPVQFTEADALGVFSEHPTPVDRFHRQLVTLTLPNGRSLLVDVFRIRGGRRHDVLWHAPSPDPVSSLGEPEVLEAANLLEYFQTEIDPRTHSLFTKPIRWEPQGNAWRKEWLIQPEHYAPTSAEGRINYTPWEGWLKDVRLRLWTHTLGSQAEHEVIAARGPWPSMVRMRLPGGDAPGRLIALKDALSFLYTTRQSERPGLQSAFVHVLEPSLTDQQPALDRVEVRGVGGEDDGVLCVLTLTGGQEPVLVATTHTGGEARFDELQMRGRLGMAHPASGRLVLYDGTRLRAGGWNVELEPTKHLTLLGIVGDLTGTPEESALIVESADPLPTGGALTGTMLTVRHQISPTHTTGYTIAGVSDLGQGRYRIDLEGTPPFLIHRMGVRQIDEANPRIMYSDFRFFKGQGRGLYRGRRIRFPRTGFECALVETPTSGWNTDCLELAVEPPQDAVNVGDPFVVYQIQPGDQVVIPSHFACTSAIAPEAMRIDIAATGEAQLTIPGQYNQAMLIGKDGEKTPLDAQRTAQGLTVRLSRHALADGRAIVEVSTGR